MYLFKQATLDRLSKLKITCSNYKALKVMDVLGENHNKVLNEARTRVTKEIQEITDKEVQHASSGRCTKGPSGMSITCETCQLIKSQKLKSHPGFIVAFDNIDIHLERREMTMSAQNRDIHWVNHEMVQNMVSGNHLDSKEPKAHIGDVPNIKFLPDIHDQSRQRLNYVILVSRFLVSHFECFKPFQNVCIQHIPHKYSEEQSMKSVKVSVLSLQAILKD